ncbi:hypothetical protein J6590_054128 [Homalodisca vitripennis]|nr:hypothetical protein J6590_054128 [Homalodisca vitripennis]
MALKERVFTLGLINEKKTATRIECIRACTSHNSVTKSKCTREGHSFKANVPSKVYTRHTSYSMCDSSCERLAHSLDSLEPDPSDFLKASKVGFDKSTPVIIIGLAKARLQSLTVVARCTQLYTEHRGHL